MKKIVSLVLSCLCFSLLYAQSPKGKWVAYADGRSTQIEFNTDSSMIVFTSFEDIRQRQVRSRRMRIQYLNVEKQKNKVLKYTVQEPEKQELGLVYVFDQDKDRMRIFVKERFREGESLESFVRPAQLGIRVYRWAEVDKIMQEGKDPNAMSREDALVLLERFKKQIIEVTGGTPPEKPNRDHEVYLFNYYFDILVDMGYNIFENEKRMNMGIEPYQEDPEVQKLMDEIEDMIEGKRSRPSDSVKEDDY